MVKQSVPKSEFIENMNNLIAGDLDSYFRLFLHKYLSTLNTNKANKIRNSQKIKLSDKPLEVLYFKKNLDP